MPRIERKSEQDPSQRAQQIIQRRKQNPQQCRERCLLRLKENRQLHQPNSRARKLPAGWLSS